MSTSLACEELEDEREALIDAMDDEGWVGTPGEYVTELRRRGARRAEEARALLAPPVSVDDEDDILF